MLDQNSLATIFTDARTYSYWLDKPVTDEQLHRIYDLMKFGPTSSNSCPARIVFVRSSDEKGKLVACMSSGNMEKTRKAPVTAIIGMDMEFYEKLPTLFPHADARSWFAGKPESISSNALRNSSLQGAYLMIAARSVGLDCGPMSGFDAEKINEAFFHGTSIKVNFVCNLGYGDAARLHERLPRLPFDEACAIV
ncbi:MAG: malonic semialdehyde reductase [Paucimonas sp.]|nr:malonic semialdehyde reductase [Paucimonas sp.]